MRLNLIIITTLLLALSSFILGVYSLIKNPKARVVRIWFLASMAVTIWSVGYILTISAPSAKIAFQYIRVVYFAASLIPILSFHFISCYLFRERRVKPLLVVGYILSAVFIVLTCFTNYIVSGVRYLPDFGSYEEIETPWFYLFLAYFLFYAFAGIYLLIRAYPESDGIRRRQIKFLALALTVGFLGGISNFITDLTGIYPYGQMIVWLYPILVTWGIFVDEIKIKISF